MPTIKILSDQTINKIAAGEVIERPVSVIKELVENALDAGSTEIVVKLERGGKNLISVSDNGSGINPQQIAIAVERHATSKLDEADINNISFYGFRGEALPSIGAISKLRITSKTADSETAWRIEVNGGEKSDVAPALRKEGTTVEVFDIFSFTPARLKFLNSESNEKTAAFDLMERFALANPEVTFKLVIDEVEVMNLKAQSNLEERVFEVFDKEFKDKHIHFENKGESISVFGYASLPTLNYANQNRQYLFVNKRVVKDKLLLIAIKAAYQNLIMDRRHPALVLFLDIDPYAVDVNVHPAKAEVRFRDQNYVRSFIISSIRSALKKTLVPQNERIEAGSEDHLMHGMYYTPAKPTAYTPQSKVELYERMESINFFQNSQAAFMQEPELPQTFVKPEVQTQQVLEVKENHPLGYAKFQIFDTYIIAHSDDGVVIVDQHAAHERLVLEELKQQIAQSGGIKSQILLVPEVVEISRSATDRIMEFQDQLRNYGFEFERNGVNQIVIRQIPVSLIKASIAILFKKIAEDLEEHENLSSIDQIQDEILGNFACHYSIRSGRALDAIEMNKILRDIERTPFAGQCNHGRPTYIKISKDKLSKMFERS